MPMRQASPWRELFMKLAVDLADKSKDPSTQVGALLIRNRRILGMGYNGPPARIDDSLVPWDDRDAKQPWIVHAEINALKSATECVEEATLYVTGCPCHRCMLMLAAWGIRRIVYGPTQPRVCDEVDQRIATQIADAAAIRRVAYVDLKEGDYY